MKNVLITGASSGIGEQTARYLSEVGYHVIMVARNEKKLSEIAKELPNSCDIVPFDLMNLEQIEEIFKFCKEKEMKLDGFVHCAGITHDMPVRTNDLQELSEIHTINYASFVEFGKYFSKKKYSNDDSSIVAISSVASKYCSAGLCNYSASKAAVNAAVKVMAKEFIHRRIRVNSIMPAYVKTPMISDVEEREDLKGIQPLGIIEPIYISYLIEWLLSDKSKYVTGSHIPVSAGLFA